MGNMSYTETDATGVRPTGQLLELGVGSSFLAGLGATGASMSPSWSVRYWPWCIKYPSSETSIPKTTFTEYLCLLFVLVFVLCIYVFICISICCSSNICSETVADESGGTALAHSK